MKRFIARFHGFLDSMNSAVSLPPLLPIFYYGYAVATKCELEKSSVAPDASGTLACPGETACTTRVISVTGTLIGSCYGYAFPPLRGLPPWRDD